MGLLSGHRILIITLIVLLAAGGTVVIGYRQFFLKPTNKSAPPIATDSRYATPSGIVATGSAIKAATAPHSDAATKLEVYDLAITLAKYANSLEINNCHQTPQILKVDPGKNIIFHNQDSVSHVIVIDGGPSFALSANGSQTIVANFSSGWGEYVYDCDSNQASGTIVIIKQ